MGILELEDGVNSFWTGGTLDSGASKFIGAAQFADGARPAPAVIWSPAPATVRYEWADGTAIILRQAGSVRYRHPVANLKRAIRLHQDFSINVIRGVHRDRIEDAVAALRGIGYGGSAWDVNPSVLP